MKGFPVCVQDCKETIRIMRKELPKILQHEPEPEIRRDIVVMIYLLGGRGAADALISALSRETNWSVTEEIILCLSEMLLETKADSTTNKIAGALLSALSNPQIQGKTIYVMAQDRLRTWSEKHSTKS